MLVSGYQSVAFGLNRGKDNMVLVHGNSFGFWACLGI